MDASERRSFTPVSMEENVGQTHAHAHAHGSRHSSICVEEIDGHSHKRESHAGSVQGLDLHADSADRIHHLLHHLHNFHQVSRRRTELLVYMGLALIYFAIATTLLIANFNDQEFIEINYFLPFHYTEFWSAFLFTLVEAFIFVSAGMLGFESRLQKGFMVIVASNIVSSFIAALLFTFYPVHFERPAHYIEYGSQITVTLANFAFILPSYREGGKKSVFVFSLVLQCLLLAASIVKVLFYTSVIEASMGPERSSHFFEFTGEMVNSMWAFVFALAVFLKLTKSQEQHDTSLKND